MLTREELKNYLYTIHQRYSYYKPTEKQIFVHNSTKDANEICFEGANRSGKTYLNSQQVAYYATGIYPNSSWYKGHKFDFPTNGVCLAHNAQDIREIWQDYLFGGPTTKYKGFISEDLVVKKIYSNKGVIETAHIKNVFGGISQIQFKTYGQGIDKMQGKRYNYAAIDEEPDSLELYHEILLRLMDTGDGMGQGKMLLTMTPKKGMTALVSYFMKHIKTIQTEFGDKKEEFFIPPGIVHNKKMYVHCDWDEATFLTEQAKEAYRANIPPHLIDCVTKGLPVFGDGLLFPVPDELITVEPFEIPDHFKLFNGLDFGFKDHTAVAFFAWDRDKDVIYLYKEYKQNLLTMKDHAPTLQRMGCDTTPTICDPWDSVKRDEKEAMMKIKTYQDSGLNMIVGKRTPKTLIIDMINDRMRRGTFKVFKDCLYFLNEKKSYVTVNGKIQDKNDHLIMASIYGMAVGLNYATSKNSPKNITKVKTYLF